ncbi:MAG: molybdopterin dinucleotide binding domain-containing protein [Promethearchaeia archaeon]
MKLKVSSIRMLENDQAREYTFGDNESFRDKLAVASIHPDDFEELGMTKSLPLHLENENGEVNVWVKKDEEVPKGYIYMPVSIYFNQISGVKNGEIIYKNVECEAFPTRDQPLKRDEIIKKIKKS